MKTKLLGAALALMMSSGAAISDDAKTNECFVAIENAERHDNVWQEKNLTMEECRARAYKLIDIGNKLIEDIAPAFRNQYRFIPSTR